MMSWWTRLKAWQKAGVIVGSIHFVLYMAMLLLLPPIWGYVLFIMDLPWTGLLVMIGFSPVTDTGMAVAGIIGTFLYALSTMLIGWLLTVLVQKIDRYRKETPHED